MLSKAALNAAAIALGAQWAKEDMMLQASRFGPRCEFAPGAFGGYWQKRRLSNQRRWNRARGKGWRKHTYHEDPYNPMSTALTWQQLRASMNAMFRTP